MFRSSLCGTDISFCFIPSTSYYFHCVPAGQKSLPCNPSPYVDAHGQPPAHFNATLQVAVSWLFFGVARSLRINLDMLDGRALKNSQLIRRLPDGVIISHYYMRDGTLALLHAAV
jgi:hypothetical protein